MEEFKKCEKCGRLHQNEVCPFCAYEDLTQLISPEWWWDKEKCPKCVELDVALHEALKRKPENRYDKEVGYIVNKRLTVREAKEYMCSIHRRLLEAYDNALHLYFPADFVLSRTTTRPAIIDENYTTGEGFLKTRKKVVRHYEYECSLVSQLFTPIKRGEQYFAQFSGEKEVPICVVLKGDSLLLGEPYVFTRPDIMTEGKCLESKYLKERYSTLQDYFRKYHAAPWSDEKTDKVKVWCVPAHFTPKGEICNGAAEYGGAYRVVCEKCRAAVKLWEYGVDYDIG